MNYFVCQVTFNTSREAIKVHVYALINTHPDLLKLLHHSQTIIVLAMYLQDMFCRIENPVLSWTFWVALNKCMYYK